MNTQNTEAGLPVAGLRNLCKNQERIWVNMDYDTEYGTADYRMVNGAGETGADNGADGYRTEYDSMGEVRVPADKYWGAQTQRSLEHFPEGTERMPLQIIWALTLIKKAAAIVNLQSGRLDSRRSGLICTVCDEILAGTWDSHFPLVVWQTGSGTQTNMNVNEVIAGRANSMAGERLIHPNDHVNMSQSSNDTFPSAMHISAVLEIQNQLLPALDQAILILERLERDNVSVIKTGRTHLQDATPIRFSQEISGWREMLCQCRHMITQSAKGLHSLALGGTAVGTGLNAPADFGDAASKVLEQLTGQPFFSSPNKFHALSGKDGLVFCHGSLKALAVDLMKIANDIRWLASGPRCGLGEIFIPENEPGSSIMPGKVNPTQCESMTMISVQVMANDVAVGMAASQGNFELNVYMPVCAYNFLQSACLLAKGISCFSAYCLDGITANRERMEDNLNRSLMLVTALNPYIGYDNAARIAKHAYRQGLSLKAASAESGLLTEEQYDSYVNPEKMV